MHRDSHTDVVAVNGSLWCSEAQANILIPSSATLSGTFSLSSGFLVEEDRLLLESALALDCEFGCHGGWWCEIAAME